MDSASFLKLYFLPSGIFWDFSDFIKKSGLPGVDTVHSGFQDFYFENEIEFLKTDFTKNLKIIFIIFENFWGAFQDTSFFGLFLSFRCFPRYRNSVRIFYFIFFLSPCLTRDPPTLNSVINAETLSIPHLMFCPSKEINPVLITHTFLSFL